MRMGSALRNNKSMNTFQIAFPWYTSKATATKKASCAAARLTRATPSKHILGTSRLKPFGSPQSANSIATCPNIEPASFQKTLKVHPTHPKPSKIATQAKEERCAQDAPRRPKTAPRRPQNAPRRPQHAPRHPAKKSHEHPSKTRSQKRCHHGRLGVVLGLLRRILASKSPPKIAPRRFPKRGTT